MGSTSVRVPDDLEEELERFIDEERLDTSTAVRKLLSEGLVRDDELEADGARAPIGHTLPNRFYTYVIASMWARRRCDIRTSLTATPSPADSLVACGDSLIPRTRSRVRLRRPREARATAEWVAGWRGGRVAGGWGTGSVRIDEVVSDLTPSRTERPLSADRGRRRTAPRS